MGLRRYASRCPCLSPIPTDHDSRSGKSSIANVVFNKMEANETLYLESNRDIKQVSIQYVSSAFEVSVNSPNVSSSIMDFQVWDFPENLTMGSSGAPPSIDVDAIFRSASSIIWVVDAQDEYYNAVTRLTNTVLYLCARHPAINVEVFVHKVDNISEEYRADLHRDIAQRVMDEVADAGFDDAARPACSVAFFDTSIYDMSIYAALSRVIQRLIPQLPALENLLNTLASKTGVDKAYLVDTATKVCLASDTSPPSIAAFATCCEFLDQIIDISSIYGWKEAAAGAAAGADPRATAHMTFERDGSQYLYFREVNNYLALLCIMTFAEPGERQAAIEGNMRVVSDGINDVFEVRRKVREEKEAEVRAAAAAAAAAE